ncbi:Ricin-type beta-trefoil lectin domain-like [Chitinophaga rupis]|uniref:Ricin-type beta-trefoil lectin domain-like n=1 Tax=Chitinophaga rupis TaxID=573321 RepID=A0A1H7RIB0_9BACT|nr:RICIN domain-containing protein [Chitinophaga rupis]SEL59748.1 Ricin-type beta-trefoil lectin domain-like [Chitinophaga rupis]
MKTHALFAGIYACLLCCSCGKNNESAAERSVNQKLSAVSATAVNADITDYTIYTFSCVAGGKYMEVTGFPTYNEKYDDQRKITQYASSVSDGVIDGWQRWHIIYKTTVNNTRYYHIRNVFSGKLLDVPGGSKVSGTQLQQYFEFPLLSDEQLWSIEPAATTGAFRIINKGSGMALTNAGSSTTDGTPITQETAGTGTNQQWILTAREADTYRDDRVVRFFNRNSSSMGSVAFDEGTSIPLSNGKVLWVTQDAWDGASLQPNGKFSCNSFFSYGNSILIQPSAGNWDAASTPNMTRDSSAQGRPKQICDIQPGNSFAWPGPGVEIGNHVYIQCGEGSGLSLSDQSLYDLTENTGTKWQVKRTTPAGMSGQNAINYSSGMVKAADGYVYVFGAQATGFGYTNNVHVARFPVSNPQSWTFWNGAAWVSSPVTGDGARITDALGTAAVAYVNGKYVMVTMDQGFNCDNSRNIYTATATSPTGPFSVRKQVYTIKEYLYGNYARYYTPAIHPESVNGRNELLVTYCLNFSACGVEDCVDGYLDPYFYRVKGIRVPYGKIGL